MPHAGCLIRDAQPSSQPEALGGRKLPNSQGLQHDASLNSKNPGWLAKTSEMSFISPLLLLDYFYAVSRHFNCLDVDSSCYSEDCKKRFIPTCCHKRYSRFGAEPRVPQKSSFKAPPNQLLQSPFFRGQQGPSLRVVTPLSLRFRV